MTIMAVTILVSFGSENVYASDISIEIDDELIDFPDQAPYFCENNRVQVPVRFVSEELGGYVEWDGDKEQIEISYGDDELVLNIKEKKYQVNDEMETMDTVPKISEQGRTMVPLRFVSEGLGAYVEWDSDSNSVYISTPDESDQSDEEGSSNDSSDLEEFEDMDIEVHASALNVRVDPTVDSDQVYQIQAGETYNVLDQAVIEDEEEYQDWLKIDISEKEAEENEGWVSADYVDPHDSDEEPPDDADDEEEREEREEAREEERQLWEDIIPEEYTGSMGELQIDADSLNVRRGPGLDYDRITQVDDGEQYPMLSEAAMGNHLDYEDWFKIDLDDDEKGWVAADYVDKSDINYENDLDKVDFVEWLDNDNNTEVRIGPTKRAPIEAFTKDGPERLVIDLDGIGLDTDNTEWELGTSTVERIRAHEYDEEDYSRVVFDIEEKEHYSFEWEDSHLVVRMYEDEPLAGKSIFIDPGHGGSNSGAIGPTGLKEKDVALDVSLMTRDLLEDFGAEVYLSRETDETLDLDTRVEMTNDSDADLFISVHANAHPDSGIQGTETFYSSERSSLDFDFADALQDSLLHSLERDNRGVKDSRFRVLRNAKIPAALVELAFLSNREEEELLRKDEFREDSAEGIVEGILNYDKMVN